MHADQTATAKRLRAQLSEIFRWAIAHDYRDTDPTLALGPLLPKGNGGGHHEACHHSELPAILRAVDASGAWWATKSATRFLALTAVRTMEVLGARWAEVDMDSAVWTIPASRTKTNREHRVALSAEALKVLAEARKRMGGSGLVFPSHSGRPLGHQAIWQAVREYNTTPHGFRSAFRSWAADNEAPGELAEAALGHVLRNQVEAAYQRSDLLERRRPLMQDWADYVGESK